MLIKKKVSFVKSGLKFSRNYPILDEMRFYRSTSSNQWNKNSFFCGSYYVHNFGEFKIYPTVLDKLAIQSVVSSHVSADVMLRNNELKSTAWQKLGHEEYQRPVTRLSKTFQVERSCLVSSKTIWPICKSIIGYFVSDGKENCAPELKRKQRNVPNINKITSELNIAHNQKIFLSKVISEEKASKLKKCHN